MRFVCAQASPAYVSYVAARHLSLSSVSGIVAVNAIPGSVIQVSLMRATSPNWTPPIGRSAPPIGRNRLIRSPNAISWSSTPSQALASGLEAARWVSSPAPTIARTMNTVPPRRYIPEIVVGSPIRRRIHVARSSNACISMSRNSAAAVNTMMYGSCGCDVRPMLSTSTRPMTTTAFSGRRCPNTANAPNWVVAHSTIPRNRT